MCNHSMRSLTAGASLAEDLVVFYDEYGEFEAYCAFLCDSLSAMATSEIVLDDATRRGVGAFAGQLKYRVAELKLMLKQIQKKAGASN